MRACLDSYNTINSIHPGDQGPPLEMGAAHPAGGRRRERDLARALVPGAHAFGVLKMDFNI